MESEVLIENNNQVNVNDRNKDTESPVKEEANQGPAKVETNEASQKIDEKCSEKCSENPDKSSENSDNPDKSKENLENLDKSKANLDKSADSKEKGMDETDYLNELTKTINQSSRNNSGSNSRNNSLNQKESSRIGGLFRSSRSSSSIQHPLNTSRSNNEISTSATLTSNHSLKDHRHLLAEPTFSDINQNASPNSTTNRQSILNNFNDWLSSISSGSLFQNFLFTNPFRLRRGSRTPASNSPNMSRSNSKNVIERPHVLKEDSQESNCSAEFDNNASMLIGTLKPTLKGNELIELANLRVEIDTQETGLGHRFEFYPLTSHTFCDNCSEFIWTPIIHKSGTLNSAIFSPLNATVRCINCKYLCHYKCSRFVRINCQKQIDQNLIELKAQQEKEKAGDETEEKNEDLSPLFDSDILEAKIQKYNERIAHKGSGLGIYLLEDKITFRGFLKVHLNLTRPINVIAGQRPPSIYDIINEEDTTTRRTLTTFYMPRDTVKNIHINSKNTSIDVIKAMLKKFKMVDNHQKFALYRKYVDENGKTVLSRLHDLEYPLKIALDWLDSDEKQFVLQENDTADVNWELFSEPELMNFLRILDHEEKQHVQQVKTKYKALNEEITKLIDYKSIFSDAVYV